MERYGIDERECQTLTYRELIRRSDFGDDSIRNCLITLDFKIVSTQYYIYEHFMKWKMENAGCSAILILLNSAANAMQCNAYHILEFSFQNSSHRLQLNNNFEMIVIVIRRCYTAMPRTKTHHQCQQ